MSDIELIKNPHNINCDTYGCSNIGEYMIGKPGENLAFHHILCDECLHNIINAMENKVKESLENVGKALEGVEDLLLISDKELQEAYKENDLKQLSFNDLKALAIEKGLMFKVGMSKPDLINYLLGKE